MLSLLGKIYGKVMEARNLLYDRGVFDSFDLGARTISVGNITTGGTGKTPLVGYIARELAARGERVCILTRGYGRRDAGKRVLVSDGETVLVDAATGGDEPVELANRLIGKSIVIADADRVAAGEWAKCNFGVTAFILDDGFQHRRARRSLDIVCIDADDPYGGGAVLPAGRLREPLANLSRANIIVVIGSGLDNSYDGLSSELKRIAPNAHIFEAEKAVSKIVEITELFSGDEQRPLKGRGFAFCGLGRPENFYAKLSHEQIDVVGTETFADHHNYTQADITDIESDARSAGAGHLLTTVKDAVKLSGLEFKMPCYAAEIELRIYEQERFRSLV
jgi:tetraacyldisaccharide 4'-kinase